MCFMYLIPVKGDVRCIPFMIGLDIKRYLSLQHFPRDFRYRLHSHSSRSPLYARSPPVSAEGTVEWSPELSDFVSEISSLHSRSS